MKRSKAVRKAVIPAAGLGTRFLPATKAMPKEMLPIVDKPVIQYIVEELVASGIEEIILVTGQNKRAIEDHFDISYDIEAYLSEAGKEKALESVRKISNLARFVYIRQKGPYGNATPLLNARDLLGQEPFIYAFGDDVIDSETPVTKRLIDIFTRYGGPVVGVTQVPKASVSRYGVIKGKRLGDDVYKVQGIVEKPEQSEAPSDLAVTGRYLFTPEIFGILNVLKPGKNGELWIADAVDLLIKKDPFYAYAYQGAYYDCGNKLEYIKANVDFALKVPEFTAALRAHLKEKTK